MTNLHNLVAAWQKGVDCGFAVRDALLEAGYPRCAEWFCNPPEYAKRLRRHYGWANEKEDLFSWAKFYGGEEWLREKEVKLVRQQPQPLSHLEVERMMVRIAETEEITDRT